LALLDYLSATVKEPLDKDIIADHKQLIATARPQYIYTHNLADKHDTHVGVGLKVIHALRELPRGSALKNYLAVRSGAIWIGSMMMRKLFLIYRTILILA
jgi:hypothetical protein